MAKSRASGATSKASKQQKITKPTYLAESEKAVKLTIGIDYFNVERTKEYTVWVPKSQLADDGRPGSWISSAKANDVIDPRYGGGMFDYWKDADGKTFQPSKTARDIEFEQKRAESPAGRKTQKSFDQILKIIRGK
jgi:hypothetical protein